jgi:hypothetical protein
MMQSARDTALFIAARLRRSWGTIPPADLHRLLLLAQSWHMLSFGREMFPEAVIASPQGPVVQGVGPLDDLPRFPADLAGLPAQEFLAGFCQTYGAANTDALHEQTDREDGAWALTRLIAGDGQPIHPDLMRAAFRLMLLDHADAATRNGAPAAAKDIPAPETADMPLGENVVAFRRA